MTRVLFILKYREVSDGNGGTYSVGGLSSGLFNSARLVAEMLNTHGVGGQKCEAKLVQVIDNNDIDREVTSFKPDVCIIEAFWVVPEKFDVLQHLHPKVKWLIRNHSNIPFLAQEGIAFNWVIECLKRKNVYLATNTQASLSDLRAMVRINLPHARVNEKVLYFPNYYIPNVEACWKPQPASQRELNVGCFGAVRVLKNHAVQAIAAIKYSELYNKKLNFHINSGRIESGGEPVLKNLRSMFANSPTAKLVEHTWMPHSEFVKLIGKMDISLQVSISETFNIVTADAVTMGVPVVGSPDVFWINDKYKADPLNSDDIVKKMELAIMDGRDGAHNVNRDGLTTYNRRSITAISNCIIHIKHHHDI